MVPPSFAALALLVLVALPAGASAARAQDRVDGWSADLDHWLAAVERGHYVYRGKELPQPLLARADWLREHLPQLSDQRILLELTGTIKTMRGQGPPRGGRASPLDVPQA